MKTMEALSGQKRLWVCGWIAACTMVATSVGAQSAAPRITSEIRSSEMTPLKGSAHPLAQAQFDTGRVPGDTRLNGISIVFKRSAAQQADLEALIAAQQDSTSPLYHQWLNPDQFGQRFGMAQADLDKVASWLQQQGFSIDSVSRSRNLMRFSGTVSQVEYTFSTQMHYFKANGRQHFAPSTELAVPVALAASIQDIRNLDDFRPSSHVVLNKTAGPRPSFTSSLTGTVFFSPGDIKTVYDFPLAGTGLVGSGQSIAVVGQSAIQMSDIENFQRAAGLPIKDPTLVLMPGTGISTAYSGDETESDLDLEWAGAVAPGADIFLVYVGSSVNYGTFDAMQYAMDENIAHIISVSYGACELVLGGRDFESAFQQATSLGQTIIAASGDSGSTACFRGTDITNPTLATQELVSVSYPASSPFVTGVGGTEITAANAVAGSAYWAAKGTNDEISSALIYIPEVAWNDDAAGCGLTDCLSASGGGASALYAKPSWQATLTPADGKRDVPDIALYSSQNLPGYLYCTSDSSSWRAGQQASCNSGFRDSTSGLFTVAGGTSFAAPVFAGMLAIINQKAGYTSGQGQINQTLYGLATTGGAYAAAGLFHDTTIGSNNCLAGSVFCSSSTNGFAAVAGYDKVTGLGSVDLNNLTLAWPANTGKTAGLIGTATSVSPASDTPLVNVADVFTITVKSDTGASVPGGTVSLTVDDGAPIDGNALDANGKFAYTATFTTTGTHQVIAHYSGDATHARSTGVDSVFIGGTFKLTASPASLNVTQGSSGMETITITPAGGYTGTVLLSFDTSNNSALTNLCWGFTTTLPNGDGSVPVTGTSAVTTVLTFSTKPADCGLVVPRTVGGRPMHAPRTANPAKGKGTNPVPAGLGFAGLVLVGFLGRYSRKFSALAGLIALVAIGLTVSACGGGGGGGSSQTPDPPKGSYTITVTGQDSISANIPIATTTFTFVIQ